MKRDTDCTRRLPREWFDYRRSQPTKIESQSRLWKHSRTIARLAMVRPAVEKMFIPEWEGGRKIACSADELG
ncbi:MAG: hypothetical protein U0892_10365 [Pirellulales bacterium]